MKSFFKISLIYILVFELIFQFLIFFDVKYVKIPDLFYNGYCDQKYWNFKEKKNSFKDATKYHPVLSYVKKDLEIPDSFNNQKLINNKIFIKNKISFYGSSYIDHEDFKILISSNKKYEFKNYALSSYGLDQIYLSYKLTAHLNQNRSIIIGFLLEDLDRSIFHRRDYEKVIFKRENGKFRMKNTPVNIKKPQKSALDLYLFRFLINFYSLIKNNFDPRLDDCKKDYKTNLLNFYLKDMLILSEKYNQKLVFVTFNLKQDLIKEPTWRYYKIKDSLIRNGITHVDAYKILENKSSNDLDKINSYFGSDRHNNKKSFALIVKELFKEL